MATSAAEAPAVQAPIQPPPVSPISDAQLTGGILDEQGFQILNKEEKIEYRDEHGNVLDPEQVEALRGQVEFQTRYETRTRLLDAAGNEIYNKVVEGHGPGDDSSVAEKPDPEPETAAGSPVPVASDEPAHVDVDADLAKEERVEAANTAATAAEPEENPEVEATA